MAKEIENPELFLAYHSDSSIRAQAIKDLNKKLTAGKLIGDDLFAFFKILLQIHEKPELNPEAVASVPLSTTIQKMIELLANNHQPYAAYNLHGIAKTLGVPEAERELAFHKLLEVIERCASVYHFSQLIHISEDKELPEKWKAEARTHFSSVGKKIADQLDRSMWGDEVFQFTRMLKSQSVPKELKIELGTRVVESAVREGHCRIVTILSGDGELPREVTDAAKAGISRAYFNLIDKSRDRDDDTLREILNNPDAPREARVSAGLKLVGYYTQQGKFEELLAISRGPTVPKEVSEKAEKSIDDAARSKIGALAENRRRSELLEMSGHPDLPFIIKEEAASKAIQSMDPKDANERRDLLELLAKKDLSTELKVEAGMKLVNYHIEQGEYWGLSEISKMASAPGEVKRAASENFETACFNFIRKESENGFPYSLISMAKDEELPQKVRDAAKAKITETCLKAVKYFEGIKLHWRLIEFTEKDMPDVVRAAAQKALSRIATELRVTGTGAVINAPGLTNRPVRGTGGVPGGTNTKRLLLR
ncbi:MAG: hypothetical protein ABIF01_05180 [Candidatus Micrarchaeota archaeon]